MERFGSDYNEVINLHCLRVFGIPEVCETDDSGQKLFGLDSYPRVAQIFLRHMDKVGYHIARLYKFRF